MRLLDLPPEVLDLIIDRTLPEGLESFVLSCKAVYVRASAQILQHNEHKRRWACTNNAQVARRGDTLRILYQISQDPIIAQYIESLKLWDQRTDEEASSYLKGYAFREDEEVVKAIKALLHNAASYATMGVDGWWQQILREDTQAGAMNEDQLCATIALLGLLPNIKVLQLPDRWHEVRDHEDASHLVPYVESLVALSNASSHLSRPLGSLETILPFAEEGYDIRVGLQCLQPFMYLESIRNLFLVSCVAIEDDVSDMSFTWPNPSLKSPLTRIELASCCMDAIGLAVLFANAPAITIFRYSHQTKWDDLGYDWNPGEVLEAIANYYGHQLQELAITVDELHGEIINGLSSFLRFTALEKLEVDVQTCCGPPVESGQRLGRNAFLPEGSAPWGHADIPCMGDMLPISIRELHVNTDHPEPSEHALTALFKNIKPQGKGRLTLLKTIVIRQYKSSTAKGFANTFNAIFEAFDANTRYARPRSLMPEWKREFNTRVGGIVMTTPEE